MAMTSRERVLAALRRSAPDRVPLDMGGTTVTTLTDGACRRLRAHLGLPADPPPRLISPRNATAFPDEAMVERFSLDLRMVVLGSPLSAPDRPQPDGEIVDGWGVFWRRPGNGHYIPRLGPLQRLVDPKPADLDAIAWPDPADPGWVQDVRERALEARAKGDPAVVLSLPAGPVHISQFMRGYTEWLEDVACAPAFLEALLDRIVDIWIDVAERAFAACADLVDVVTFSDDVATQRGPLIRPEQYRRLIKPRHRRMIDALKRHGKPLLYHCCGSVVSLIPDFIDMGADALNPVQVAAAHMDTRALKREFGRDLAFWGAIDTQRVLPLGTVDEVREEVRRRIEDLAGGGGYVLAAVHNIQADAPPRNVAAMLDAGLEFGR
jgi:uroporphyrinogen decarboxylase